MKTLWRVELVSAILLVMAAGVCDLAFISDTSSDDDIENIRDVNQQYAEVVFALSVAVLMGYRVVDQFTRPQSIVRHLASVNCILHLATIPRAVNRQCT